MGQRRHPQGIQLTELARYVDGQLHGPADRRVTGVSSLEEAGPEDLTFLSNERYLRVAGTSRAAAIVVARRVEALPASQIVVDNPIYAIARIVEHFFLAPLPSKGVADQVHRGAEVTIGPGASIWPQVVLGDRVHIGARVTLFPGVFIGDDCRIGDDTVLHPNVTVREDTIIGARVIVHSGTVIGSDGFGYVQRSGKHHKIPQIGGVLIEDDVELGANVTVDRATFGRTVIKRGTKVDNLVQIAHNVVIGEDSVIVAQVGIAGSSTLGRGVMVGGQVGITDHVRVGDRVMIAARAGVTRDIASNQIVSGAPAIPHAQWLKAQPLIPRLPELRRQLRELQERVEHLEAALRAAKPLPRSPKD